MHIDTHFRTARRRLSRLMLSAGLAAGVLAPIALGARTADAAPPTLEPLRVYARGQEATVEVAASQEVAITHTYREGGGSFTAAPFQASWSATATASPATASPTPVGRQGGGVFTTPAGPGGVLSQATEPVYQPRHRLELRGLKSNTTYTLSVVATNRAGEKATAETTFTTLKKRVRVTLDQIVIHNDGDLIGDGEPTWLWTVGRPVIAVEDCFPKSAGKCKEGSFGAGTIVPSCDRGPRDHRACAYTYVFAEENFKPIGPGEDYTTMPTDFLVKAKAVESDAGLGWLDSLTNWGAFLEGSSEAGWQAPQGVESASTTVAIEANDGRFRSTMTFRFELFHDNASFPPNDGRVHSTSK